MRLGCSLGGPRQPSGCDSKPAAPTGGLHTIDAKAVSAGPWVVWVVSAGPSSAHTGGSCNLVKYKTRHRTWQLQPDDDDEFRADSGECEHAQLCAVYWDIKHDTKHSCCNLMMTENRDILAISFLNRKLLKLHI